MSADAVDVCCLEVSPWVPWVSEPYLCSLPPRHTLPWHAACDGERVLPVWPARDEDATPLVTPRRMVKRSVAGALALSACLSGAAIALWGSR